LFEINGEQGRVQPDPTTNKDSNYDDSAHGPRAMIETGALEKTIVMSSTRPGAYSLRKVSAGFIRVALIVKYPSVIQAVSISMNPDRIKTIGLMRAW